MAKNAVNEVMESKKRTTFDGLVSQMTELERKDLLAKMRPHEGDPEANSLEAVKDPELSVEVRIEDGLKQESLFYRMILWLRSIFASTTVEQLYNDDKIMSLYRKINHNFPGLVDYRDKTLLGVFYEKLIQLKRAADFFKPYINEIYKNIGAFYVYLGSFIAPEVTSQMNIEVDPNNLPLEREVTNELRASLLRKMEDILKSIPPKERTRLYQSAASVEWLCQFIKLPFELFISAFSNGITNSQVARFESVASELNTFSRILCNGKTIPIEALESIYLYSAKTMVVIDSAASDDDSRAKEFMDKASSFMMVIHEFIKTVPLHYVNKIVFNNLQWRPDQFGGAEDWFVKYKDQWKRLFEEQWSVWLREKRRYKMSNHLKEYFGIETVPLLPNRPWANMWGGIPFHFENTAGFLYWFTANKLMDCSGPLKTLLLEGQFVDRSNHAEFADALNELDQVSSDMYDMVENLSNKGSTGSVFDKLAAEHLRSLPAQSKIDSLMLEHENKIQKVRNSFCDSVRSINSIMGGVFSEAKDSRYDGISNLASIQGNNNANFRAKLMESKKIFEVTLGVVKELEQIDLPASK